MAKIIDINTREVQNPDEEGAVVKLASISENVDRPTEINGVVYYPDETSLRKDRLSDQSMIWLDDLADKGCKKCYGTGRIGYMVWQGKAEFKKYLHDWLDTPEKKALSDTISKGYGIPITVELLTEIAKLPKGGPREKAVNELANEVSKAITKRNPIYCRCFILNYNKKLAEIRRVQKFGVIKQ